MNHINLRNFDDVYSRALAAPYVDGAAIVAEWRDIEPRPNAFDWSNLDRWVREVVRLHKKISIGVIAGFWSPNWLYRAGVPKNYFDYNRNPRGVACTLLTLPSPWSPVYLRDYGKMIEALSRHLRSLKIPGQPVGSAFRAIRVVKLSGINNTTEELQLDATPADAGPCHQSDAAAVWAKAGFTPQKILSTFLTLAAQTAKAFPGKILSVEIIHRRAFPSIDDSGHVYAPSRAAPDDLTTKILEAAIARYDSRLMVQWDALWQGKPPQEVLEAAREGARIGWQMNGFLGVWGGSGCIYRPFVLSACRSAHDFQSILKNGIRLGAAYIEIQAPDADAMHSEAFDAAHASIDARN